MTKIKTTQGGEACSISALGNDDVVLEVFAWLPANSLYKFSAVSKSARKLLTDEFFVKKHSKNTHRTPDSHFFVEVDYGFNYPKLELRPLNSKNKSKNTMPEKSLDFLMKHSRRIIASSNGLLCLRNEGDEPLTLFNPTTGNHLSISNPFKENCTIAFDCTLDLGYFLVAFKVPPPGAAAGPRLIPAKIHSPELNAWLDVGNADLGHRSMNLEHNVRLKDTLYMISDTSDCIGEGSPFYWPYVVAYDLKTSCSSFLDLPKQARNGLIGDSEIGIFKWGHGPSSTVCLVKLWNRLTFSAWVMAEGVRRWVQVLTTRCSASLAVPAKRVRDDTVMGFTVANDGVLVFATPTRVYSYDLLKSDKGEEVCKHGRGRHLARVALRSWSSTLRPCGGRLCL